MTQLDKIQIKIEKVLTELSFFDASDLDNVNVITTTSSGSTKDAYQIHLESGMIVGGQLVGRDTEGRNVHLPLEYIIDIN